MSITNTILDVTLVPPALPQSSNGIIDKTELSPGQDDLVVIIKKHEKIRVEDFIIVYLTPTLSATPYPITDKNVDDPRYQITIPFSEIPLGSYDVYYTITNLQNNTAKSESTHVTIKKSGSQQPQPPVNATLTIIGCQIIGDKYSTLQYEILTIQVQDSQTYEPIKNTAISYKIDQSINMSHVSEIASNPDTVQPMTTDEYGQLKINLQGQKGGYGTISVTANNYSGRIKYTMKSKQ